LNKEKNKSPIIDALLTFLKGIGFPILSIIIAIFIAVFFVMWAKNYSITQYFSALSDLFRVIWKGSFGDLRKTLVTIEYVTPILFTGLANAVAFRCGLFNIGAEGQFIMGMISAAIIGLIPGLSPIIHVPLIIIGGIVAGAIWAAIPGYLKAKVGTNEVINTIMMNYIGLYFANWVVLRSRFNVPGKANTPMIQESAQLMKLAEGVSRANISIILAVICAIFIYWLLWKTTIGYEIRAVGLNPHAAEYGGISISKNIVLAMVISGALAGLGGATHVAGIKHMVEDFVVLPGFGFDGIAVALLAKSNPIACIASALLFGALNSSSKMLQINGIPKEIVFLIQSIIIIFVATDYIVKYISEKRKKVTMING
jgi:ABC-type uncharacterized transport system permease subunit